MNLLQQAPRGVCAAIVDDNDLVRNLLQVQFQVEMFDRGGNAALFVPRGNHHREQLQRLA